MGAVTFLALALLILAVVLGVRAGQQQVDMQRRQQVGIALQQALDFSAESNLEAALDAYQHVLLLDPGNKSAVDGINNLLHLAAGVPKAGTPNPAVQSTKITTNTTAAVSGAVSPTITSKTTSGTDLAGLLRAAQTDFDAGRWQEAINQLLTIQHTNPAYATDSIKTKLFTAYVNLANEKDNEDHLEEALALYDNALALRPNDATTLRERTMIATYMDMQTYYGNDWVQTVKLLKALYTQEPDYRDVADRLQTALVNYGDTLVDQKDLCPAADQYTAAIAIKVTAGLIAKRDQVQKACADGKSLASGASVTATLTVTRGTPSPAATKVADLAIPTPAEEASGSVGKPSHGRILYSAHDSSTGRNRIMVQALGAAGAATLLHDDATQPAMRLDGQRLVFHNTKTDMGGLSAFDPATKSLLRFTEYPEDIFPSWNAQGNRLVFASNREGDRRWRIYVVWAEANNKPAQLDFGEAPAWNPTQDQIAFKGCDSSGNRCGLWTMSSSGNNGSALTTIPGDDRPTWSADGRFVVFMSSGRDGNYEIYRVEASSGQILRLTDNPGIDGLPTVSPDGEWVAFVSNRDGAWKLWATPITGGAPVILAPINGDLGNWLEQGIQWVN